jgi:hypothetical protein
MRGGRRVGERPTLAAIRARCADGLRALPHALRELDPATTPYPVEISREIVELARALDVGRPPQAQTSALVATTAPEASISASARSPSAG